VSELSPEGKPIFSDCVYLISKSSRLPSPSAPAFWLLPEVLFHSLPIAVVGFTITLSMASILAKKGHYRVQANQEFIACVCVYPIEKMQTIY